MADRDVVTLDELLALIRDTWAERLTRGRMTHVHRNALRLPNGALIHLRVLIQTLEDPTSIPTPEPKPDTRRYYGCVKCQVYHYDDEPLFEAHIMRQDKHGIRRPISL